MRPIHAPKGERSFSMRRGLAATAVVFSFLVSGLSLLADEVTLTLLPDSGIVSGPSGSTLGWGYSITNDTLDWLQPENMVADPFQEGIPSLIFDFPAVAPLSSVTEDFSLAVTASCPSPPCGLYELTWDGAATEGFVNTGTFTISAELFDQDPATPGANDLGPGPDLTSDYSAAVSQTPEPGTAFPAACGSIFLLIGGVARKRKGRHSTG